MLTYWLLESLPIGLPLMNEIIRKLSEHAWDYIKKLMIDSFSKPHIKQASGQSMLNHGIVFFHLLCRLSSPPHDASAMKWLPRWTVSLLDVNHRTLSRSSALKRRNLLNLPLRTNHDGIYENQPCVKDRLEDVRNLPSNDQQLAVSKLRSDCNFEPQLNDVAWFQKPFDQKVDNSSSFN